MQPAPYSDAVPAGQGWQAPPAPLGACPTAQAPQPKAGSQAKGQLAPQAEQLPGPVASLKVPKPHAVHAQDRVAAECGFK